MSEKNNQIPKTVATKKGSAIVIKESFEKELLLDFEFKNDTILFKLIKFISV